MGGIRVQVLIGTYGAGIWRLDTEKACAAQIAEAEHCSQERVRQIITGALRKMKK